MAFRRPKPEIAFKSYHKSPVRRLEVAFMRLDRRYTARMMIIMMAIIFTVTGLMIGVSVLLAIGYMKVIF